MSKPTKPLPHKLTMAGILTPPRYFRLEQEHPETRRWFCILLRRVRSHELAIRDSTLRSEPAVRDRQHEQQISWHGLNTTAGKLFRPLAQERLRCPVEAERSTKRPGADQRGGARDHHRVARHLDQS